MGTYDTHRYSPLGNMPLSAAPLVYSDLSYVEASRAPIGREHGDGVRFIANLGRIFRAHS